MNANEKFIAAKAHVDEAAIAPPTSSADMEKGPGARSSP